MVDLNFQGDLSKSEIYNLFCFFFFMNINVKVSRQEFSPFNMFFINFIKVNILFCYFVNFLFQQRNKFKEKTSVLPFIHLNQKRTSQKRINHASKFQYHAVIFCQLYLFETFLLEFQFR